MDAKHSLAPGPRKASGPKSVQVSKHPSQIFTNKVHHPILPKVCYDPPKKLATISHENYHTVEFTPINTKCPERLILNHIKTCLAPSFIPLKFAYGVNKLTEDE